jgi:hypothetical protein
VWDLETEGIAYLDRFNAGAKDQLWYFDGVIERMAGRLPAKLENELRDRVAHLRRIIG